MLSRSVKPAGSRRSLAGARTGPDVPGRPLIDACRNRTLVASGCGGLPAASPADAESAGTADAGVRAQLMPLALAGAAVRGPGRGRKQHCSPGHRRPGRRQSTGITDRPRAPGRGRLLGLPPARRGYRTARPRRPGCDRGPPSCPAPAAPPRGIRRRTFEPGRQVPARAAATLDTRPAPAAIRPLPSSRPRSQRHRTGRACVASPCDGLVHGRPGVRVQRGLRPRLGPRSRLPA